MIESRLHNYRRADKLGRRIRRRRVRSRVLMSARTAARNFDLQLAIATPPIACHELVDAGTIPVVHGGNRADLCSRSPLGFTAWGFFFWRGNAFADTVQTQAFSGILKFELNA